MESIALNFLKKSEFIEFKAAKNDYSFFQKDYSDIRFFERQTPNSPLSKETLKIYNGLYCDYKLNDVLDIDSHFDSMHSVLKSQNHLLIRFEPQNKRRKRLLKTIPFKLGKLYYYTFDFLAHRIFSRLALTKNFYFRLSNGKNQVLSIPEVLGRVIASGFELIDFASSDKETYVLAIKGQRQAAKRNKSNGLLINLHRVGYLEKRVNVLKFRTMRPYSEHIQEYVFVKNGTLDGDKIINDFRITGWGKIMRKYWVDELPMIVNLLRGQIKLIGVRPLSEHKFYSYPKYLQKKRVKVKPGLLPPYYADLPKTPEEFHKSEVEYTDAYLKSPIKTDIKYFFKIIRNILLRGARSK
ncbi:sugar transferase [Roseivirga sp.]|uniref:sugar transferase n=1 Tax=Roseivirga sp. TaxID=1964215 RepID=UPI003B8A9B5B